MVVSRGHHLLIVIFNTCWIEIPGHDSFGAALRGNPAEATVVGAQVPNGLWFHLIAALDGSVRLIAAEPSEDFASGRHIGPDTESDHLGWRPHPPR